MRFFPDGGDFSTEQATIVSVDAVPLGTVLAADADAGDTTISVVDSSDFYQTGGFLSIGGAVYQFVAVDGDNDLITLTTPISLTPPAVVVDNGDGTLTLQPTVPVVDNHDGTITATFEDDAVTVVGNVVTLDARTHLADAGEPVLIWDNAASRYAVKFMATLTSLDADMGEPMVARVDHGVFPYLPVGPRDLSSGQGEAATIENRDGEWWVTTVSGRAGTYAPGFLADLPAPSSGVAPGSSPTPNVTGGIGSLFIDWSANSDSSTLVTYDVHVSLTSGFVPSPADLVISTTGTYAVITQLADGTPLSASTGPYYVVLVARNVDGSAAPGGQASASPRTVSGPDIDANWVYANGILANQIEAGTITSPIILGSSIKTAASGARVEEDAAGIRIYDPTGTQVTNLATNGTNYFSGNVDAGTLTAEGATTFLGPVEIANGVTQTLDSVFAPGTNAPSCSCGYIGSSNSGKFNGQPQEWLALNYSAGASQMYAYVAHAFSGGKQLQVWAIDNTGNQTGSVVATRTVPAKYVLVGAGVIGTTHWFYLTDGAGNASWTNMTTGVTTVVDTSSAYSGYAAGTSDGTNLWTVNTSGANIIVKKWNPANLAGGPLTTTTITPPTNLSWCWGMYVGAGDFGSTQIGLSLETVDSHGNTNSRQMLWYGLGGTPQPNNTFNSAAAGSNSGVAYDGTSFWSACFFNVSRYEGGAHVLTGASATWYSTYTWRNDASSYESVMSTTPRSFTMKSRAAVVMNGMTVPTGADHLGFYAGPATGRTSQWLQGESTGATLTLALGQPQDLVLSGTNPPATGTFPTSAAGAIVSGAVGGGSPLIQLNGDGTYRLAGTNLDDVAFTTLGNTVKYRVHMGVVYVYVNNSSFTVATGTKTVISTSAIPAAYRPSGPVYAGAYFSGQVGLVEVDSDGNLYGTQNSGGSTSNVSGMVSYPVGL